MEAALTDLHGRDSMAATLPLDIIALEILPRLPAKSLLQLKCVCKLFKTLISSSEFINLHLCHSQSLSSHSDRLLILFGGGEPLRLFSFNLDSPESKAIKLPFPRGFEGSNPNIFVVGSCNGLLCIQNFLSDFHDSKVLLLNPSTGICRTIPFAWRPDTLGFGYDSEADDYKIVAMKHEFSKELLSRCRREVMVYSLKANTWRLVEKQVFPQDHLHASSETDVTGVLIGNHLFHWMVSFRSNPVKNVIQCFNLRTEQWGNDVPLPDDLSQASDLLIKLGVLDGCLCFSVQHLHQPRICPVVDVWIMKEYGVKESWVKLFTCYYQGFDRYTTGIRAIPLAFRRGSRNEVLIWQWNGLFWYNIRDNNAKKAEIHDVHFPIHAYVCSGSLVSLPGGTSILE